MGTIIILLDFIFIFLAHTLSENLTSNMKSISYALLSRYSGWTYISISYLLYFSSFSFCLAWAFISLQIQEFWLFGVHINDNIFASLFLNKFISYCMYCCIRPYLSLSSTALDTIYIGIFFLFFIFTST